MPANWLPALADQSNWRDQMAPVPPDEPLSFAVDQFTGSGQFRSYVINNRGDEALGSPALMDTGRAHLTDFCPPKWLWGVMPWMVLRWPPPSART